MLIEAPVITGTIIRVRIGCRKIFTGSTEAGKSVMRLAADGVKRIALELGGKSACLIFGDADLSTCLPSALWSVFFILTIIAGVTAWLFVLAQDSRRVAEEETRRQTDLLMHEIEAHKLEEWEGGEEVARPLGLMYRCLQKLGGDAKAKEDLYRRICRLDPLQAIAFPAGGGGKEAAVQAGGGGKNAAAGG